MKIKGAILVVAVLFVCGCTCNDCEIRKNEPLFKIEFYSSETLESLDVNFGSINGVPSADIEVIGDDLFSEYHFPLNMHQDSCSFVIHSFKSELPDEFIDTLAFTYSLELFQTERDFVQFRADSMKLRLHTYDSASFICANPDCTNAEVTLRLFY